MQGADRHSLKARLTTEEATTWASCFAPDGLLLLAGRLLRSRQLLLQLAAALLLHPQPPVELVQLLCEALGTQQGVRRAGHGGQGTGTQ